MGDEARAGQTPFGLKNPFGEENDVEIDLRLRVEAGNGRRADMDDLRSETVQKIRECRGDPGRLKRPGRICRHKDHRPAHGVFSPMIPPRPMAGTAPRG